MSVKETQYYCPDCGRVHYVDFSCAGCKKRIVPTTSIWDRYKRALKRGVFYWLLFSLCMIVGFAVACDTFGITKLSPPSTLFLTKTIILLLGLILIFSLAFSIALDILEKHGMKHTLEYGYLQSRPLRGH